MSREDLRTILFSSTETFGGHEKMLLTHIAAAKQSLPHLRFVLILNSRNRRFAEAVESLELTDVINLVTQDLPRLRIFRPLSIPAIMLKLARLRKQGFPKRLVLVQGNPDVALSGAVAAKLSGFHLTSYLPMPHKLSITGGKLPSLRDPITERAIFPLIDDFIVISEQMKHLLHSRNVSNARISVVENSIITKLGDPASPPTSKKMEEVRLLLPGRIQFKQKGHDFLLEELRLANSKGIRVTCDVVGDGPDMERLRNTIDAYNLSNNVILHGWQQDIAPFFATSDAVILPSRYEGVPLVMLEAMLSAKVILTSNIQEFADYIPPEWSFDTNQPGSLVKLLQSLNFEEETNKAHKLMAHMKTRTSPNRLGGLFVNKIAS